MSETRTPLVIFILPDQENEQIARLTKACRRRAREDSIRTRSYRAIRTATAGGPWERPVRILNPSDAFALYRALHRSSVLVVSFTQVYVPRDPSQLRVNRRDAATLRSFVAYKSLHALIRGDGDVSTTFDEFAKWRTEVGCTGDGDPRVLPLHVFDCDRDWDTLSSDRGRADFRRCHGSAAARKDASGRRWLRARRQAYHGTEALAVANRTLDPGMHWDVVGGGRMPTAHQVWLLRSASSYLNVYPDGFIRRTAASGARLVWPARK